MFFGLAFFSISFSCYFTLYLLVFCCGKRQIEDIKTGEPTCQFNGPHVVLVEMLGKFQESKKFCQTLQLFRAHPPSVVICATAYHFETETILVNKIDSQGRSYLAQEQITFRVNTWTGKLAYLYKSWEERGKSIDISGQSLLHTVIVVKIQYTLGALEQIQLIKNHLRRQGLRMDQFCDVFVDAGIPETQEGIVGYFTPKIPLILSFFKSTFAKYLHVFMAILGFQAAYETIFAATGERCRLTLVKAISDKNDLRCHQFEPDRFAAETTFLKRGKVKTESIQQGLLSPEHIPEPGKNEDSFTYYNPYDYDVLCEGFPFPNHSNIPSPVPNENQHPNPGEQN